MKKQQRDIGESIFTPTYQILTKSHFNNLYYEEKLRDQELDFEEFSVDTEKERELGKEVPNYHGILNGVFFFFPKLMNTEEEEDGESKAPKEFFFHSNVPLHRNVRDRLIGQIQAFLIETNKYHPRNERVIVITFENVQLGMGYINSETVVVVGFHKSIPMTLIRDQMHSIVEGMILLHGPQIQDLRIQEGLDMGKIFGYIGEQFVTYVKELQANILSIFQPISYFPLPYKHNSIFLKASQLLDRFHRISKFEVLVGEGNNKKEKSISAYLGGAIILGGEQTLCRTINEDILQWLLVRVKNLGSRNGYIQVFGPSEEEEEKEKEEEKKKEVAEDEIEGEGEGEEKEKEDDFVLEKDSEENETEEEEKEKEKEKEKENKESKKISLDSIKFVRKDIQCIFDSYFPSVEDLRKYVEIENEEQGEIEDRNEFLDNISLRIFENKKFEGYKEFYPTRMFLEFGNIVVHYSFVYISSDGFEGFNSGDTEFGSFVREDHNEPLTDLEEFLKLQGFPKSLWNQELGFKASCSSFAFCVIIKIGSIVLLRLYDLVKLKQFIVDKKGKNHLEFGFSLQKLLDLQKDISNFLRESEISDFPFIQHQGLKMKNPIASKSKHGSLGNEPLLLLSPQKEKKTVVQNIVHQRTRSGSVVFPAKPATSGGESLMVFDTASKILEGNFSENEKRSFLPKFSMIHSQFQNSGFHKVVLKNSKETIYAKKVFDQEVYYVKEAKKNEDESLADIDKRVREKVRAEFKINIM